MQNAQRSQYLAGDIDIARQSYGLTQQALDLNRQQLDFNRKMLVANTIIQGTQLALNATELGFKIRDEVYNNRSITADRANREDFQLIEVAKKTAVDEGYSPFDLDENGQPKGWGKLSAPNGELVGDIEQRIQERVNSGEILKTKWGQDKYLNKVEDKFADIETNAMVQIAGRERKVFLQNLNLTKQESINDYSTGLDVGQEASPEDLKEAEDNLTAAQESYRTSPRESGRVEDQEKELEARVSDAELAYSALKKRGLKSFVEERFAPFRDRLSPSQWDALIKETMEGAVNGKIQHNALALAENQNYAEARELAETISPERKDALLKGITEIQRTKNRNTWGRDKNLVLGAGSPWDMLDKAIELEPLYREGNEYDSNYSDQDEDQSEHHKWFINKIEELRNETRARAERGKDDTQKRLYNDGLMYIKMLQTGKDADGNAYFHKDFSRDAWDLVNQGLEMERYNKLENTAYDYLPPYLKDVIKPKLDAILKPLEEDGINKEAWNIRQLLNEAAWSGKLNDEKAADDFYDKLAILVAAETVGRKGRKNLNAGAFINAEATTTDRDGRVTQISVRHGDRNDQRTTNQSVMDRNTKNTTWEVGQGSRTDGTFTLTDKITKERLTARVSTSGKPEVMINGSWQSFEKYRNEGIDRRMEQIYNELTPDKQQRLDKIMKTKVAIPRGMGVEQYVRETLQDIYTENVIETEWYKEFRDMIIRSYWDNSTSQNKESAKPKRGGLIK